MTDPSAAHSHVFLGAGHERSERKTWAVIWLCGLMMIAEIIGGAMFGSVALVADGLHMSTHAGALLIAALAYTYARRHAIDARFTFGTGKLGDLAGFTSAIILAMIALLIGYEAVSRLLMPVKIDFNQAIPIAALGLIVNVVSAWLLSGGGDHQGHQHRLGPDQGNHAEQARCVETVHGILWLEVFEDGVPPRFRLRARSEGAMKSVPGWQSITVETERPDGSRQIFSFADRGAYLESIDEIAEPHEFIAHLQLRQDDSADIHELSFVENAHGQADAKTHRDNNFRAALVHVIADAAVSVLVIGGLILARLFGWLWMDPVVGIVGAAVIANWAYGLIRDAGAVLLDMSADDGLAQAIRKGIETDGDRLADLHLWRLGPGHLGAIVSVLTAAPREGDFYRAKLSRFRSLSHLTIEVRRQGLAKG